MKTLISTDDENQAIYRRLARALRALCNRRLAQELRERKP